MRIDHSGDHREESERRERVAWATPRPMSVLRPNPGDDRRAATPGARRPGRHPRPGPGPRRLDPRIRPGEPELLDLADAPERGQPGPRPGGRGRRHDPGRHRRGHRPLGRLGAGTLGRRAGDRHGGLGLAALAVGLALPGRRCRLRVPQWIGLRRLVDPLVHRHAGHARGRARRRLPDHRLADAVHRPPGRAAGAADRRPGDLAGLPRRHRGHPRRPGRR